MGVNWKRVVLRVVLVAWGLWAIYIAVLYWTLFPLPEWVVMPEWVVWLDDNLWFLVRPTGLGYWGMGLVLIVVPPAAFIGTLAGLFLTGRWVLRGFQRDRGQ